MISPLFVERGAWVILLAGLGATLGVETDWGRQWEPTSVTIAATPENVEVPALTAPFKLPSPDQFLETSLRPLFISGRRPAPVAIQEVVKPAMRRDQFLLTGTTVVPEGKFAFLVEKASNKVRVVTVGKDVNGLRVADIQPDKVTLAQDDESEVLTLKTAKGVLPTAAPGNVSTASPPPQRPLSPAAQNRQPRPSDPGSDKQQPSAQNAASQPTQPKPEVRFGP